MLAGGNRNTVTMMGGKKKILFTVPRQRTNKSKRKEKKKNPTNWHRGERKGKKETPQKGKRVSVLINTRRGSGESARKWLPHIHTQPYSYHRDSRSSGLSDGSEPVM